MVEFQCAVASAERGEPLFATASHVLRWLLIEVRGAWGHQIVGDTNLRHHVPRGWAGELRQQQVRPVAIRRDLQLDGGDEVTLFYVETGHGAARPGSIWRRVLSGLGEAVEATAGIVDGMTESGSPGWEPMEGPLVLVCTNGRHDSCCATFGRPLIRHLRQQETADVVWECSHIGGDRFAANVVLLPDGIYYGRVTVDRVDAVLAAYARSELDLDLYRGRSTLGYTAQAAEYFVRRELDLTAIDAVVAVRRLGPSHFEVDVAGCRPRTIEVVVERALVPSPTPLTCTGAAEVSYPAYRLSTLAPRG